MTTDEGAGAETCRVFVAIPLPEHVKDRIGRAQEQLRAALPAKAVRWSRREQFHLTLKFLGRVEARRVDQLIASVRGACAGFGVLQLRAGQIGFFPDARRPRVIWTRVRDEEDRLPLLQRAVEAASAGFTSEAPESAFTGHVTLGRCRMIRGQGEKVRLLAEAMTDEVFGEWTADRVEIIGSDMQPAGSRYTTLASVPLQSPPG